MLQIRFQYQINFEICWSPSPATGKAIHSNIKDANNFIDKVNYFSVPVNSILVTMEVKSLYTSIRNSVGITAAKKRYENYIHKRPYQLKLLRKELDSFLTLYWRYLCGMGQVWKQLNNFMNELNQKHPSVNFDYKFDCRRIEFLQSLVYINQQNKLQTKFKLLLKMSHAKLKHPYSLKKSITYSLALRIWRICSTLQDYHNHSRKPIEQFVGKRYKKVLS